MIDTEWKLRELQAEYDRLLADNHCMREAIAETTERLGHAGCEPVDLADAVGQMERLLDGKDTETPLSGLAERLRLLVVRAAHHSAQ